MMEAAADAMIAVGRISGAHGIRGQDGNVIIPLPQQGDQFLQPRGDPA